MSSNYNFIEESRLPFPFCPGCSHGILLSALERALKKINADPKKTVLVSDIGCVGMADQYFNLSTFHGLHGRSFTYASGIKMAHPELNVIVIVGDGGCSIGGNHLINAARRNIGLTVLCFNNLNYGMTGGEQSVTTPLGGITNSNLQGSLEQPFDLCSLVASAGASFVARKTAYDNDLDEILAHALQYKGFSFIDAWEICTAYYSPMNQFEKENLQQFLEEHHLPTGILLNKTREEFSQQLSRLKAPAKPTEKNHGITTKYQAQLPAEHFDVLIAGSAGMKIVSAAGALCQAGILSDLWVSQKDDYPVTVKTGHSLSMIRFSKNRIHDLCSSQPQAVILLSKDGVLRTQKLLQNLGPESYVLADETLLPLSTKAQVFALDMSKKTSGLSKTQKALAAITVFLREKNILSLEALRETLEAASNEAFRQENLASFDVGLRLTIKK